MSYGETVSPFLGRLILAWYFGAEAYSRTVSWRATVEFLASKNAPEPLLIHIGAVIAMILGSLSLFLGCQIASNCDPSFASNNDPLSIAVRQATEGPARAA